MVMLNIGVLATYQYKSSSDVFNYTMMYRWVLIGMFKEKCNRDRQCIPSVIFFYSKWSYNLGCILNDQYLTACMSVCMFSILVVF